MQARSGIPFAPETGIPGNGVESCARSSPTPRDTETRGDLLAVRDLLTSGAIAAVIDRTYPLADIAAAHRHVEQGHKRGNVVIRIDG
jgi:NADPH:quinone reductase-like Zn-dependent oxidoreductase